jgi:hypothetical protein
VKLLTFACLFAVALAVVPSASADQQLAEEQQAFIAAAHGDVIVWSSYDAAGQHYRLMTLSGSTATPLPIAPRPEAFDVSLGPGENGSPVAVYSRCTGKTPPIYTEGGASHASSGCDIYRYDFASSQERKVESVSSARLSETQPSIRGRRIAFVRELRPRGREVVRNAVYTGSTTGTRKPRRRPNPRSPRGGQVEGVSLTSRGLLFVWRRVERIEPVSHPILVRAVGRRALELDRIGSGGAAYGQLLRPSVRGGHVYYGRQVDGRGRIWRVRIRGGSFAVGRGITANSISPLDSGAFVLSNSLGGACLLNIFNPPSTSLCTLTVTDPVSFKRHRRPRGEQT